jgi:replicative DNA helicase
MNKEYWKKLKQYNGKDRIISSHQIARRLERRKVPLIRVKSLMRSLDTMIQGFQEGELIIISGPPKSGKTLLAQTLTVNFNIQKRRPLWFSYEVPLRQFFSQFPSPPKIYLPGQLKAQGLTWLKERIWECYLKHKTRVIFIDHLHYLIDIAGAGNSSLEIGAVIRQLKTLAVRGRFTIFLLAHTTKGAESNLNYGSIRDSSFIAQESDCVLMIQRTPWYGENAAQLSIEFHRRTGVLKKRVNLIKFKGLLIEKNSNRKKSGDLHQEAAT